MILCLNSDNSVKIDYKVLGSLGTIVHHPSHLLSSGFEDGEEVYIFVSNLTTIEDIKQIYYFKKFDITFVLRDDKFKDYFERYGKVIIIKYRLLNYSIIRSIIEYSEPDIERINKVNKTMSTDLENMLESMKVSSNPAFQETYTLIKNYETENKELNKTINQYEKQFTDLSKNLTLHKTVENKLANDYKELITINKHLVSKLDISSAVVYKSSLLTLPSDVVSLYIKNYNASHLDTLVLGLQQNLNNRSIYSKVLYLYQPTEYDRLLIPDNFLILDDETTVDELLISEYIAITGDIQQNMQMLLDTMNCKTFIIIDNLRELKDSVLRYTMKINTVENESLVDKLNIVGSYYLTNSKTSEHKLLETRFNKNNKYKLSQQKEVSDIIAKLLNLKEEQFINNMGGY